MEFEEKTLSRREIYKGPIFQLVQDQVELPNEKGTEFAERADLNHLRYPKKLLGNSHGLCSAQCLLAYFPEGFSDWLEVFSVHGRLLAKTQPSSFLTGE